MDPEADGIIEHMNLSHLTCRLLILVFLASVVTGVNAARVPDLYSAIVPARPDVSMSEAEIFSAALTRVLVKITGQPGIAADPTVMGRFGNAERYIQQHRMNADGSTWVLFDQAALRKVLDNSGQPVWGEERPVTLAWVVLDDGQGARDILPAASQTEQQRGLFAPEPPADSLKRQTAVREILQTTADQRGLPLVLPLVDSEELDLLSIPDIWGGYNESLELASQRYGVDATLIGRARVNFIEVAQVRWTLLLNGERFDWEGGIADGPDRIADFFAARFATSGSAMDRMQMRVDGIQSLTDYGRLNNYLASLDVIETFAVERVEDQTLTYALTVRGDGDKLRRSIALRRVLVPVNSGSSDSTLPDPFGGPMQSARLHYSLVTAP